MERNRSVYELVGKLVNEYGLEVMIKVSDHLSGKEPDPELVAEVDSIDQKLYAEACAEQVARPPSDITFTEEDVRHLAKTLRLVTKLFNPKNPKNPPKE